MKIFKNNKKYVEYFLNIKHWNINKNYRLLLDFIL